jgi:hypothetical protein
MIWLAWRQHRQQALAGAAALGLVAAFLLVTHAGMSNTFRSLGLSSCGPLSGRSCAQLTEQFDQQYRGLQFVIPLFLAVPLLIGMFWGAPVVARELEQGTHRLVWTQSITRRRWFSTRVLLQAGTAAAGVAAIAALVSWWSEMLVHIHDDRFTPGIFDIRGIVPVAYVLFAVGLGVLMSALVRRTLPAMAATLAGFIGVRTLVTLYIRPHYLAARTMSYPVVTSGAKGIAFGPHGLVGLWILRQNIVDRAGTVVANGQGFPVGFFASRCPGALPPPGGSPSVAKFAACLQRLGIHSVTTYQPGSRFWAFQGIESAIYVALAAVLIVVAAWVVRRRLA